MSITAHVAYGAGHPFPAAHWHMLLGLRVDVLSHQAKVDYVDYSTVWIAWEADHKVLRLHVSIDKSANQTSQLVNILVRHSRPYLLLWTTSRRFKICIAMYKTVLIENFLLHRSCSSFRLLFNNSNTKVM